MALYCLVRSIHNATAPLYFYCKRNDHVHYLTEAHHVELLGRFHNNQLIRTLLLYTGISIHRSFNRAVTIQNCHNILVQNNVVYDVKGGAFVLEDGIETGKSSMRDMFYQVPKLI